MTLATRGTLPFCRNAIPASKRRPSSRLFCVSGGREMQAADSRNRTRHTTARTRAHGRGIAKRSKRPSSLGMTKDETAEIGPPVCTVYGPRLTPFSPAQLTKLTYYAAECNWACNCGFRCASDYVRRARPDSPARSSAQRGTENGGPDVKVRTPSTCPAGWPRVAAGAGVVTVMALVLAGRCRPVSLPMRCWWPDGAPLVRPSTCLDVAPTWPRRDDCGG